MGEATSPRARASIESQTQPPHETITVGSEVSPYHRALNHAASLVSTEFLVPVDADMVLDPSCFEDMRSCAADRVAVVVACLRDPMLGRIEGVKLIRTESLLKQGLPDSVSPDVDFVNSLADRGWTTLYALKFDSPIRHTLGEHRPDYTPRYTFGRFYVQGVRHRYRGSLESLQELTNRLAMSDHPCAPIAVLAAAHGVFRCQEHDQREAYTANPDFEALREFRETPTPSRREAPALPSRTGNLESTYHTFLRHGSDLQCSGTFPLFEERMLGLARSHDPTSWMALLGLCHGLFKREHPEQDADEEFRKLFTLLPPGLRLAGTTG